MAAALTVSAPLNPFRSLWSAYERSLRKRPLLTQSVSSAVLWGLGDGMAQRIETGGRGGLNARRVALTAAFGGAVIGPVGHVWYELLERLVLRLGLQCAMKSMLFKVAVDNLVYSPCYVLAFFAYGCLAIDGLSGEAFAAKLRTEFLPTMVAELAVWPPYMAAVFSRVPVQHQLLAVNVATLFDVCFLSWTRTRREGEAQPQPLDPAASKPAKRERQAAERRRWRRQEAGQRQRVGAGAGQEAGQKQQQQEGPRSAGEAMRRELEACLWDASPEPSLGRRALMAASATCSSAGGGAVFW